MEPNRRTVTQGWNTVEQGPPNRGQSKITTVAGVLLKSAGKGATEAARRVASHVEGAVKGAGIRVVRSMEVEQSTERGWEQSGAAAAAERSTPAVRTLPGFAHRAARRSSWRLSRARAMCWS